MIKFKCPDGVVVETNKCLRKCRLEERCTIRSVLKSWTYKGKGEKRNDIFSVLELIIPHLQLYLLRTQEIIIEPYRYPRAFWGRIAHELLKKEVRGGIKEKEITTKIQKYKLVGRPDILKDGVLIDYKTISIGYIKWLLKGSLTIKEEWKKQLDYYDYLLYKNGEKIKNKKLLLIAYDSIEGKEPFWYSVDLPLISDYIKIEDEILKEMELRQEILEGKREPEICENWNWKRCEKYCLVSSYCPYYQRLISIEKTGQEKKEEEISEAHQLYSTAKEYFYISLKEKDEKREKQEYRQKIFNYLLNKDLDALKVEIDGEKYEFVVYLRTRKNIDWDNIPEEIRRQIPVVYEKYPVLIFRKVKEVAPSEESEFENFEEFE